MAKPHIHQGRDPVDVAYELLRAQGAPMVARALLAEAISGAGEDPGNIDLLAELQTEISLDNRFVPGTHGTWGLHEWAPRPKPSRAASKASAAGRQPKADPAEDEEVDSSAEPTEDWD